MKVHDFARRLGLPDSKVRYYDQAGLIRGGRQKENPSRDLTGQDALNIDPAQMLRSFGMGVQEALAAQLGKSQSAVANKLRLLKLSPDAVKLLRQNGYSERHARALLRLPTPEEQRAAAQHVVEAGLTVARTEAYVVSLLSPGRPRSKPIIIL